jgi:hypothetical protein
LTIAASHRRASSFDADTASSMAMFLPASSDNHVISGATNSSATARSASPGDTGGALLRSSTCATIVRSSAVDSDAPADPKHDKKISNIHD